MNPADRPTLLIVDDLPANLGVLVDFLGGAGYRVLVATSGEWALEQLAHVQPDLILLDLAMPGWDGYETCRRLKADDRWREIPVLILTALSDVVDKVRGFEAGAVDFITKPLEPAEVLARVRTHLQIRALQKTLEERNALLRETSALLQQSLDRAVVLARPDGEVAFCTRRARDLLDQHFPGQGSAARLPDAVVGWHARQPAAPWRLAGTVAGAGLEIRTVREPGHASDDLIMLLLEGTAAPDPPPSAAVLQRLGLTAREAEALYWITYGKTTAEIAEILGTSPGTVKKQVQAMLEKLGVETRLAAALRAMEVLGLPVSG
jgi:DNA-binding response OmpR family regulator/DNA-binding CsgD family transcriptional regulator